MQKPGLVDNFFSWTRQASQGSDEAQILNAQDFLLHGIYSPKSVYVRT